MPEVVILPGIAMIRLLPRLEICSCTVCVAPVPTATVAMTADTPMTTPSIVSAARILLVRNAVKAILRLGRSGFILDSPRWTFTLLGHLDFRGIVYDWH